MAFVYLFFGLLLLMFGIGLGYFFARNRRSLPLPLSSEVLLAVTVPVTHADIVRDAMGKAGAGQFKKYAHCSFSFKGLGRFMPLEGSNPVIGKVGELTLVEEETIQMPCSIKNLKAVITALKKVHPYNDPGIDIVPLYYVDYVSINKN